MSSRHVEEQKKGQHQETKDSLNSQLQDLSIMVHHAYLKDFWFRRMSKWTVQNQVYIISPEEENGLKIVLKKIRYTNLMLLII